MVHDSQGNNSSLSRRDSQRPHIETALEIMGAPHSPEKLAPANPPLG